MIELKPLIIDPTGWLEATCVQCLNGVIAMCASAASI